MYRVIIGFHDLHDGRHEYRPGDEYPRAGYEPGSARIEELSGCGNARRTPLIEEIAAVPADAVVPEGIDAPADAVVPEGIEAPADAVVPREFARRAAPVRRSGKK